MRCSRRRTLARLAGALLAVALAPVAGPAQERPQAPNPAVLQPLPVQARLSPVRPFAGLPHRAVGAATLTEEAGTLRVGIPSGTEGGVQVDFGEAEFFRLRFPEPILAADTPDGATLSVSVLGPDGKPLGSVTGTDVGREARMAVDFRPVGTARYTIRALRAGRALVDLPGREWVFIETGLPSGFRTSVMKDGRLCILLFWDEPMLIRIEGGPTIEADRMFLESDGARPLPARHVRSMRIAGKGLGSFVVSEEALGLSGTPVVVVGAPRLSAGANGVAVGSTDRSGGVRVDTGPVPSVLTSLAAIVEARQGKDGGTIGVSALGGDGRPLGTISAIDEGESFRQQADFSPLGAETLHLRLERQGKIVYDEVVDVGTTTVEPGLGASIRTSAMEDGSLCIMFMWDEPQPVRIGGGEPILADRLFHISVGGKPLAAEAIGGLEIAGRDFPSMTLTGVQILGPPKPH